MNRWQCVNNWLSHYPNGREADLDGIILRTLVGHKGFTRYRTAHLADMERMRVWRKDRSQGISRTVSVRTDLIEQNQRRY